MSPCVLTRECSRLLYISITIMLLSLSLLCYYLKDEVEVRGIPLCITFNFCTLHTTSAHLSNFQFALSLLLSKVNKKIKKEKEKKKKKRKRRVNVTLCAHQRMFLLIIYLYHYYVISLSLLCYYLKDGVEVRGIPLCITFHFRLKSHHFCLTF